MRSTQVFHSWPDRPPIALPSGEPAFAKLKVESIATKRQGGALDVGNGEQQFAGATAAYAIERHAEGLRRLLRCHAEGKRYAVGRRDECLAEGGRNRNAHRQQDGDWISRRHGLTPERPSRNRSCIIPR